MNWTSHPSSLASWLQEFLTGSPSLSKAWNMEIAARHQTSSPSKRINNSSWCQGKYILRREGSLTTLCASKTGWSWTATSTRTFLQPRTKTSHPRCPLTPQSWPQAPLPPPTWMLQPTPMLTSQVPHNSSLGNLWDSNKQSRISSTRTVSRSCNSWWPRRNLSPHWLTS